MDLSKFKVDSENQTAELQVLHPVTFEPLENEGKPVVIVLHGPDSQAQKKVVRGFQNDAIKQGMKKKKMNISSEQLEARALALDVASTADWKNLTYEGKQLKCTPENVKKVYSELPWLREQVEEFISERSNFLGK